MSNNPKRRMLIVCDESGASQAYKSFFDKKGFSASIMKEFHNFHKIVGHDQSVDSVLIDLDVYDSKNLKFLSKTRSHHSLKNANYYILSKCPIPKDLAQLSSHPRTKIIPKPITAHNILNSIESMSSILSPRIDYDGRIYKALSDTLKEALGFYVGDSVKDTGFGIKKNPKVDYFLSSLIPLNGNERFGSVLLCLEREALTLLGRSMLSDQDLEFSDDELKDLLNEICNQLSGIFMEKINLIGHPVAIGIPDSFYSRKQSFFHPGSNEVAYITFHLDPKGRKILLSKKFNGSVELCLDRVFRKEKKAS